MTMTNTELLQLIEQAKTEGWTELDLSGQYLTELPPVLGTLQQLQVLNLGWNKTTSRANYLTALPEELSQLTNLQSLNLSNNQLTALPEGLAQLTNLQSLDISHNKLTVLPEWLSQLTNLQALDLRNTNLTTLPDGLRQLTSLHTLDLSWNKLVALPNVLRQLTNLKSLDLRHTNLTALPEWLAQLINLQSLNLRDNHLTALPEWLAQLINLQSLDLHNTNLIVLPGGLAQLIKLHSLDLSSSRLTVLPDWLAQLVNLQSLYLSYTNLTALPKWLVQLTNLQFLDLSYNYLTALPEWLAQLVNLQSLDLSYTNLTALPDGLAQLTNLHSLDLRNTNLMALPEWLTQLTNLQSLDLRNTNLTALPDWLGQLTNLQSLDLSDNQLTVLPEWLAQLTNLQSLYIGGNYLTVLPEWLAQLTNLQSLYLSDNQLTVLPEWLAQLTNLQSLYLSGNQLTVLPNWLADPEKLPQVRRLHIVRNPLMVPPAEILGNTLTHEFMGTDIDTIRGYFRQLQDAAPIYFYEAKLLIIGEGGAGKTSLARKLVEPGCQLLAGEKSTKGIAILTWQFALPTNLADDSYTVNIWDFGGQEIYFATHQFFLTKRSVYVLVADTRRQHTDFYTWLHMQETFGEDSPVLLIKNRNRQHGNNFTIENLPQLRERFPNLKEIIEIDLNEVPAGSGWQDLLYHVQDYLLHLPHIGQPRPSTWVAVRTAIGSDTRDIIDWSAFVTLCQTQGMQRTADIQQLAEYLHNLGDILYFHEDPVLRDYVILKPTWGLDAVYKVLDNTVIEKRLGKFSRSDLRVLWDNPVYTGYHVQLLRLMENFQLCYPLPDVKDSYIAPQLLTQEAPNYTWDERQNLQLRYDYPIFMPRGILSRAIVKLHQRIEAQALVWRSGVILNDGYARAEVLELPGDKQIRVRVSGGNKRDLLMEIVRALDELHRGFPKLQFARLVPCHCATCSTASEPHFFDLDILRERLANRKATIECRYPPYAEIQIRELLSEMQLWEQRTMERGDMKIHIERMYQGDHREGDQYDIGDISAVTGLALGKQAAATVINSRNTPNLGATKALTAAEKIELDQLAVRKTEIERPLRGWARVVKYLYGLAYIGLIVLLWWLLDQLVRQQGWDTLEPITWIISTIAAVAAPLIVWLSAENLKPAAIEQWFFNRWRAQRFVKHGFDAARYQALTSKSQTE